MVNGKMFLSIYEYETITFLAGEYEPIIASQPKYA